MDCRSSSVCRSTPVSRRRRTLPVQVPSGIRSARDASGRPAASSREAGVVLYFCRPDSRAHRAQHSAAPRAKKTHLGARRHGGPGHGQVLCAGARPGSGQSGFRGCGDSSVRGDESAARDACRCAAGAHGRHQAVRCPLASRPRGSTPTGHGGGGRYWCGVASVAAGAALWGGRDHRPPLELVADGHRDHAAQPVDSRQHLDRVHVRPSGSGWARWL